MAYYLIDGEAAPEGVKLIFYNPSTNTWKERVNRDCRPYLLVPHPLSQADQKAVDELDARTKIEEKIDLFTGQTINVTKIELTDSSSPRRASSRFEKAWEDRVPPILSYVYDRDLVFGGQHTIQEDHVEPVFQLSEEIEQRFMQEFSDLKKVDSEKFKLLKRWLALCSQPVPKISAERLGIDEAADPRQYQLAFMLSRVANLPVSQAFSNRQVSGWIRSILHNYLRRKNILIPTSRELRRGEEKRRVRGALTFPPEAGVHFNTVVVDFESLYPSLIDVYNLSHETIDCPHLECRENKVPGLEHHVCQRRRGVYSVLIGSIKDLRIRWYKPLAQNRDIPVIERRLAQAASKLLKLILVSSYGVTVRIHGLARPSLAESITAYGRHVLQTTWNIAEEGGLHPVYGDTDSLFLEDPREEQVEWLTETVKERLRLDLAVEERYSVCVLPRAMKAYFGIRRDGTPDIKGVTAIKSNSPVFIQEVFRDCVRELAEVKDQTEFNEAKERVQDVVRNAIEKLKAGRVPLKDLEYSVKLHEDPQEKIGDRALHQPYQCALQLIEAGKSIQKGDIVKFVKVKPFQHRARTFTVKPTEQIRDPQTVNVEDYIRNLRTALNQTFKTMNIKFKEDRRKNHSLADFM